MSATAPFIVGLIGQVCAGKSAVSEAFRRRGARVYDADQNVHAIYRAADVIEEVKRLFGDGVIDAQGQVDRKAVGKIVFSDAAKLKTLTETVIFPRTGKAMERELEEFRKSGAPALVLDAPTLIEAGRETMCDVLLFVAAPLAKRQEWARQRGWPAGDLERREARMLDENEKRKRADAIIDNAGTLEDLDKEVGRLFEEWRRKKT
jgi:dephospho-CoA kinase